MKRTALGLMIAALFLSLGYCGSIVTAQVTHPAGVLVFAERVSATDQEADEGYFALGQHVMWVVKPGSDLHGYLRGKTGQYLKFTVVPITEEEAAAYRGAQ